MTMSGRAVGLAAGGLLVAAFGLGGVSITLAGTPSGGIMGGTGGAGMMQSGGCGGMMGGAGGAGMMSHAVGNPVQSVSPAVARTLSATEAASARVDRRTNTVTYQRGQVALVALASPDTGRDMTWTIDGLVNPTVVVPAGARVTVHVFNADGETVHGWELTTTPPPYADMAMMDVALARPAAFALPLSHATPQRWLGRTVQFTVARAGTYYYLCPVKGHAQQGMYGRLIVR